MIVIGLVSLIECLAKMRMNILDYHEQIQLAKLEDEKDYKEWEELFILAENVLAGDIDTYFKVLKEMDPLGDLSEFGSGFEFSTDHPSYLEVEFDVQSKTIIPTMEKKLTKTGKLSVKQLSKTRYFELNARLCM